MTETSDRPVEASPHPFLRGPEVADRVARLLQSVSSRASEIEAEIAREAHEAGDEDTARRLGTLLARWSATVGAYEQASMGLQLWASATAPARDTTDDIATRMVPEDTDRLTRAAIERLESPALTSRVVGLDERLVAAAPLLDASAGALEARDVVVTPLDGAISLRAAGPYPIHPQDDLGRLAHEYVSQSRGTVSVGIARRGPVPVTITMRATPPDDEPTEDPRWDHVTEASIVSPEGLLVLESAGTPVVAMRVPIGVWRVRTYVEGLAGPSADGLDGDDRYHLVLWRGRSLPDAVVVKRYPGDLPHR